MNLIIINYIESIDNRFAQFCVKYILVLSNTTSVVFPKCSCHCPCRHVRL